MKWPLSKSSESCQKLQRKLEYGEVSQSDEEEENEKSAVLLSAGPLVGFSVSGNEKWIDCFHKQKRFPLYYSKKRT